MTGSDLRPAVEENAHQDTLMNTGHGHHDGRQCGYHLRLGIWIDITASFQEGRAMECLREHTKHFDTSR